MTNRHFINFDLAGFSYYDGVDVFHDLKIGAKLCMVAEPDNAFDPHAVELYYGKTKLGYIPRSCNKIISQFLNLGYIGLFEARINRVTPDAETENQIGVMVRIKEFN